MAAEIAAAANLEAVDSVAAAANRVAEVSVEAAANRVAEVSAAVAVNRVAEVSAAVAVSRVVEVSEEEAVHHTLAAVVFKLPQAADVSRRRAAIVLSSLLPVVQVEDPRAEACANRRVPDNRRPFIPLRRLLARARADNLESPARGRRERPAVTRTRFAPELSAADVPT